MKKALWSSPSDSGLDQEFLEFESSLNQDKVLLPYDLLASKVHAKMLVDQGILSSDEGKKIVDGLAKIQSSYESGELTIDGTYEDVHSLIEGALFELIGETAGKLHIARSRNDQVVTSFKLFLRSELEVTRQLVRAFRIALVEEAERHLSSHNNRPAVMPGHTHLQISQPLHLSHWFLSHEAGFERDENRLRDALERMNECPLGSAAMCGTSWPIDRMKTSTQLGFKAPQRNSLDAVGSRDFVCEALSGLALLATSLSRLAEDLLIFSTSQFGFVTPSHAYSTGSSIMPQKRNSDFCELTRGKASRIIGHLTSSLVLLKGLPSSYQRDLQEDKTPVMETLFDVKRMLRIWPKYIRGLSWNFERMAEQSVSDFSLATDLADGLVRSGLSFRDAHHVVRQLVHVCQKHKKDFTTITTEEAQAVHPSLTADLLNKLTLKETMKRRVSLGCSGNDSVKASVLRANLSFK